MPQLVEILGLLGPMDAFYRREQRPGEVVRLPEYSRAKIRSLHSLLSSALPPHHPPPHTHSVRTGVLREQGKNVLR